MHKIELLDDEFGDPARTDDLDFTVRRFGIVASDGVLDVEQRRLMLPHQQQRLGIVSR